MIISHEHKFIFLKTHKTAGTSLEIALSAVCGPGDVITPNGAADERLRQLHGYRSAQNCLVPVRMLRPVDFLAMLRKGKPRRFRDHDPGWYVRRFTPARVWKSYFKFCVERNPFDKAVSRYYWNTRNLKDPPSLEAFVLDSPQHLFSNWNIYAIDDRVVVDRVIRYEHLHSELRNISCQLGLPPLPELPRSKSSTRSDRRSYRELLSDRSRERIEEYCAKEIEEFSYSW